MRMRMHPHMKKLMFDTLLNTVHKTGLLARLPILTELTLFFLPCLGRNYLSVLWWSLAETSYAYRAYNYDTQSCAYKHDDNVQLTFSQWPLHVVAWVSRHKFKLL